MDKKEIDTNEMIENNLYDFYLSIAEHPEVTVKSYNNALQIRSDKLWPNCIFITDEKKSLDSSLINTTYATPFFLSTKYVMANLASIHKFDLIPVRSWTNMILKQELHSTLNTSKPKYSTNNLRFSKVNSLEDLIPYTQLINKNIYSEGLIDMKFLADKIKNSSYSFFLGTIDAKPISTILTYDNGSTIGLYFISVIENERGNGYGKLTVSHALSELKEERKDFVLHARKTGTALYKKLGFETMDKMNIFVPKKTAV